MPISSSSRRISAVSGVSPGCTLPPGNSQRPARCLPSGRWASSTRPSGSTSATAATRTIGRAALASTGSAAVGAINVDVAMRQIAGPYRRPAAAEPDIDFDKDLAPFHVLADRSLAIARHRPALAGDFDAADRDGEAVALALFPGPADGHDEPPPIGVARGDRGLDQGRVADRQADPPRGVVAFGAADLDRDEFLGALAVAGELLRQIDRDRVVSA